VFGCNDGVIRLFNYIQIWDRHAAPRCEKKIESRSKSPVSSIVAFQKASVAEKDGDGALSIPLPSRCFPRSHSSSANGGGCGDEGCCLIVALQDGTVVIIDLKTNSHTTLQKVHSGDSILSITACPRRGIFSTLGADKARFLLMRLTPFAHTHTHTHTHARTPTGDCGVFAGLRFLCGCEQAQAGRQAVLYADPVRRIGAHLRLLPPHSYCAAHIDWCRSTRCSSALR
jgi:hypothetical protein